MNKDVNKNRTKNVLRNICISTIILFLGIIIIFKSFKINQGKQDLLYSYNMNKNLTYKVNLFENEFFDSQTMDMNKTYISSLVDKINMDFSYSFSGNKKAKTKYNYQIIAVTDVKYSSTNSDEEKSIWNKRYVLVEPKEFEIDGSSFNISESFDVDFATYNTEVKNFKEQLRLPVIADLTIKLIVRSDSDVQGIDDTVVESSIMNVKMDLAKDVFTVEKQFENAENKTVVSTTESNKEINKPLLVIGIILIFIAVMIILDAIRKSIKFSKKTDYAIALNRILKNYGDIVAEIVSPVEIDNLNVIEVKNFDQLLDIEEEIRMPILFYETIPDEQGEFIIICDNMAYRYVIG
ncbi:MAG: DUF5305 domain-containing protein [Clostridia bacterium]|nr:DUF5305 domain-containing protein [Clostridia bacterium]